METTSTTNARTAAPRSDDLHSRNLQVDRRLRHHRQRRLLPSGLALRRLFGALRRPGQLADEQPVLRAEVVPETGEYFRRDEVAGVLRDEAQDEEPVAAEVALGEAPQLCRAAAVVAAAVQGEADADVGKGGQLALDVAVLRRPVDEPTQPVEQADNGDDGDDEQPEPDDREDLFVEEVSRISTATTTVHLKKATADIKMTSAASQSPRIS